MEIPRIVVRHCTQRLIEYEPHANMSAPANSFVFGLWCLLPTRVTGNAGNHRQYITDSPADLLPHTPLTVSFSEGRLLSASALNEAFCLLAQHHNITMLYCRHLISSSDLLNTLRMLRVGAMFETFYQTVAQLCFTLLGLWWIVLQTKYREWIGNADRRRMATNISLYFLLPGSMSLLALLSTGAPTLWRGAFAIASFFGAIETALLLRRIQAKNSRLSLLTIARWAGLVLYLLVALVAFIPTLTNWLGVKPLLVAGTMLTILVILGVTLAWAYFMEPIPTDRHE